ncbi:hypothetical protein OAP77_00950 [Planctomycetota bacterium]|nr:hypothetical protein [Planctomycetota bacterium]
MLKQSEIRALGNSGELRKHFGPGWTMHDLSCKKRNGQDWKILWILEFKNSGAGASNLLTVLETVYGTFDFDLQGVSFPPY